MTFLRSAHRAFSISFDGIREALVIVAERVALRVQVAKLLLHAEDAEARLVRANGGSEQRGGIQDYILFVVAADHEAHEEHDRDPRFRTFLEKAERLQPEPPLVWYGDTIVERRS